MTYSEFVAYFEAIAINHKAIGHNPPENKRFFGIDLSDLTNSLKDVGQTPCIGLERPFYGTRGAYANVRLQKTGALMVFTRSNDAFDFAAMEAAYNLAYQIAEDIAAKMIKDAKLYDLGEADYTLPGLDPASFSLEPMPPGYADGGILGVRLSFSFNEPLDLFDTEKWNNESDYDV